MAEELILLDVEGVVPIREAVLKAGQIDRERHGEDAGEPDRLRPLGARSSLGHPPIEWRYAGSIAAPRRRASSASAAALARSPSANQARLRFRRYWLRGFGPAGAS